MEKALRPQGVRFEWLPCRTRMTFANGETALLTKCVLIHFPTDPPTRTYIDVHESRLVTILMSLPQMANLGLEIHTSQAGLAMTCRTLGWKKRLLPMSNSWHAVFDFRWLRESGLKEVPSTFLSAEARHNASPETKAETLHKAGRNHVRPKRFIKRAES